MIKQATEKAIFEAAQNIGAGYLVAFPTETVYGLGANALDGKAVARIFEAKQRPAFNPLISHILNFEQAKEYGVFDDKAEKLARTFWPGPVTLIVPKSKDCKIHDLVTAGLETIALRVPAHPVAQALIKESAVPIAAPSANLSGQPSATTPIHVAESLSDKVSMILAAGSSQIGLESTVIDCTADKPVILRPGSVTVEDLEPVIGKAGYDFAAKDKPRSPGQLLKHYAPSIPVRMNAVDLKPGEALLAFSSDKFIGIQGGGAAKDLPETQRMNLSESGDLGEAASNLFSMLRALDRPDHKGIAVMNIPDQGIGIAINDRLKRATEG